MKPLTDQEREYITLNWSLLRKANHNAAQASREWNERNEAFKIWCVRMGHADIVQIAKMKGANLPLSDAFATWDFWQREAQRISALLQAEYTCRQMLGGGS